VPEVAQAAREVGAALRCRALVNNFGCANTRKQLARTVVAEISDELNTVSPRVWSDARCLGITLDDR
jgi:hypothetical protein